MQNDPLRKLYVLRTQGMMAQLQEAHSYCVVCAYSYSFSLFFSVLFAFFSFFLPHLLVNNLSRLLLVFSLYVSPFDFFLSLLSSQLNIVETLVLHLPYLSVRL
jgi:hypothetical protein